MSSTNQNTNSLSRVPCLNESLVKSFSPHRIWSNALCKNWTLLKNRNFRRPCSRTYRDYFVFHFLYHAPELSTERHQHSIDWTSYDTCRLLDSISISCMPRDQNNPRNMIRNYFWQSQHFSQSSRLLQRVRDRVKNFYSSRNE